MQHINNSNVTSKNYLSLITSYFDKQSCAHIHNIYVLIKTKVDKIIWLENAYLPMVN